MVDSLLSSSSPAELKRELLATWLRRRKLKVELLDYMEDLDTAGVYLEVDACLFLRQSLSLVRTHGFTGFGAVKDSTKCVATSQATPNTWDINLDSILLLTTKYQSWITNYFCH